MGGTYECCPGPQVMSKEEWERSKKGYPAAGGPAYKSHRGILYMREGSAKAEDNTK